MSQRQDFLSQALDNSPQVPSRIGLAILALVNLIIIAGFVYSIATGPSI